MTTSTPPPATSLTSATEELRAQLRAHVGAPLDVFDAEAAALGDTDFAARAPRVGDRAPAFTLPDPTGGKVALDDELAKGRVVLVFYRGAWCPYCNLQIAALRERIEDIEAAGGRLIAVSPMTPDASLTYVEQQSLPFAVLSDVGNTVARAYGLVFRAGDAGLEVQRDLGIMLDEFNGDDSFELPAPAVFVIEPDRTVSYASVVGDYRWRVGPGEILSALQR